MAPWAQTLSGRLIACIGTLIVSMQAAAQISSPSTLTGEGIETQDPVVRFSQQVKVPALETGRVAAVMVLQNDMVETGASIARLDGQSLMIRRRASQLRRDAARSDAADDVEIRYAELALAEAEAELEVSRSIQNDVRGAVPMSQVRRLRLAVERGQLEVAQSKKRMKQAEVEAEIREADLSVIDDQLRNLSAESPIDGVVLEVTRSAGEWIEQGEPIATIGRIDRLHVHAWLSSQVISPAVCRSLPVSVQWIDPRSGDERSLRGKVLSVDPQLLPGGGFRLHAEILNRAEENDPSQWLLLPFAEVRMKVYPSAATALQPSRSSLR